MSKKFIEIKSLKSISGYIPDIKQPSSLVVLNVNFSFTTLEVNLKFLDDWIKTIISNYDNSKFDKNFNIQAISQRIFFIIKEVMIFAKVPISNSGKFFIKDSDITLILPWIRANNLVNKIVVSWVLYILNRYLNNQNLSSDENFKNLIEEIKKHLPQGMNRVRLLKIANEENIPWRHLFDNVFQFGWGSKSKLLDSTITDMTPSISVGSAKNKVLTSHLLKMAGVPIAKGIQIKSEMEAIKVASTIGYPVVIKPVDLDGGLGVSANLNTQKSMLKAYQKAKELSANIMIEKHFEGDEYRLVIHNSNLVYSTKRCGGGVRGDGVNTIKELLVILNKKRESGEYKQIPLDEEALELIYEQNLTPETVLPKDEFIKLRRAVNISSGGTSKNVDLSTIHQDNIDLAIRATKTLRLDIAGIDLIIPDITKSWLEVGAIVNEVNAQPQIKRDKHLLSILNTLIKDRGRIPVIIIFGENSNDDWLKRVTNNIISQNKSIGFASSSEILINNRVVNKSNFNAFNSSLSLTMNIEIDFIIIKIDREDMLEFGLAIDLFDAMVISDISNEKLPISTIKEYQKMCRGETFILKNSKNYLKIKEELNNNEIVISTHNLEKRILQILEK